MALVSESLKRWVARSMFPARKSDRDSGLGHGELHVGGSALQVPSAPKHTAKFPSGVMLVPLPSCVLRVQPPTTLILIWSGGLPRPIFCSICWRREVDENRVAPQASDDSMTSHCDRSGDGVSETGSLRDGDEVTVVAVGDGIGCTSAGNDTAACTSFSRRRPEAELGFGSVDLIDASF